MTEAPARWGWYAAAEGNSAWIASTRPKRLLSRHKAISAMILASLLASGRADDDPHVVSVREELKWCYMTSAVQDKGTAIVTGASRGIGASIAERLAHDGYGVVVNYPADSQGEPRRWYRPSTPTAAGPWPCAPTSPRRMTSPRCSTGRSSCWGR